MDSQMPGPSHILTANTNNTSESDSEDENRISDEEVRESMFDIHEMGTM
jgi:hypothetical protein